MLAANVWMMLVLPVLFGLLFCGSGLSAALAGLYYILMLQMGAPALMSSPAFAALMGLDVALSLATLIVGCRRGAADRRLFTHLFLGTALVSPLAFGLKLFFIIAGRRRGGDHPPVAGQASSRRRASASTASTSSPSSCFAIAAMDGVPTHVMADPLLVAELPALVFLLALGMMAVTTLVFCRAGGDRGLRHRAASPASAISALMMAATGFIAARPRLALFRAGAVSDLSAAASCSSRWRAGSPKQR